MSTHDRNEGWRYCPWCGGKLEEGNQVRWGVCGQCGRHWYKNGTPTVGVIIYERDNPWRVVLAIRGRAPKKGEWDMVGGFVDWGETPEEAVIREVFEETGWKVERERLEFLGHFWGNDYVYQGRRLGCVDSCFMIGREEDEKLRARDDVARLEWVDLREMMPRLAFEANRQELEEYVKLLRRDK